MGGFGPMLGQNHHFALYAKQQIPYAIQRYRDETHRLYGVLDRQLARSDYLAGGISIADFACLPWAKGWEKQGIDLAEFAAAKRRIEQLEAHPGVASGVADGAPDSAERDDQHGQSGR